MIWIANSPTQSGMFVQVPEIILRRASEVHTPTDFHWDSIASFSSIQSS